MRLRTGILALVGCSTCTSSFSVLPTLPSVAALDSSRSARSSRLACVLSSPYEEQAQARRNPGLASMQSPSSTVYFVMGGPGSGKGTQCARLVERFGMVHLSAGDLLREEVASGSALGREISAIIDQGQIVKSETTVALLRSAMAGRAGPFLIDGFPRSLSNLEAFEAEMGPATFMLFLEVSETEMEARLLKRGLSSGRSDDNRETITKRFRTFVHDSMPVVEAMRVRDSLRIVDAGTTEEEVFARVIETFGDQDLEATADGAE